MAGLDITYENALVTEGFKTIAGIDEVGRGPLAGPVVSACVIMNMGNVIPGINDSKKISEKKRDVLEEMIKQNALCYGLGIIDEKKIDEINILNATKEAFKQAYVNAIKDITPDILLIDGRDIVDVGVEARAVIKGDATVYTIACASIIAKVFRDRYMIEMDKLYPQYDFAGNKGYGTKKHIEALKKYGPCPIHRKTFIKKILGSDE